MQTNIGTLQTINAVPTLTAPPTPTGDVNIADIPAAMEVTVPTSFPNAQSSEEVTQNLPDHQTVVVIPAVSKNPELKDLLTAQLKKDGNLLADINKNPQATFKLVTF